MQPPRAAAEMIRRQGSEPAHTWARKFAWGAICAPPPFSCRLVGVAGLAPRWPQPTGLAAAHDAVTLIAAGGEGSSCSHAAAPPPAGPAVRAYATGGKARPRGGGGRPGDAPPQKRGTPFKLSELTRPQQAQAPRGQPAGAGDDASLTQRIQASGRPRMALHPQKNMPTAAAPLAGVADPRPSQHRWHLARRRRRAWGSWRPC